MGPNLSGMRVTACLQSPPSPRVSSPLSEFFFDLSGGRSCQGSCHRPRRLLYRCEHPGRGPHIVCRSAFPARPQDPWDTAFGSSRTPVCSDVWDPTAPPATADATIIATVAVLDTIAGGFYWGGGVQTVLHGTTPFAAYLQAAILSSLGFLDGTNTQIGDQCKDLRCICHIMSHRRGMTSPSHTVTGTPPSLGLGLPFGANRACWVGRPVQVRVVCVSVFVPGVECRG